MDWNCSIKHSEMRIIKKIAQKKGRPAKRSFFTRDEIKQLLSFPNVKTVIGKRDRALLCFMYASGARAQEICELTVGNLTFFTEKATVKLLGKGSKVRKISIPADAAEAVRYFERIHHEENLMSGMTAEERYEQRLAKVKPLLDAFFAWLETLHVSGKSALAKAVVYALNEKPYLYTFLENGNVPIDNNRAENAIRPFTVGRKNWMHSNTANGAKASAALYSIVATVQANGLNTEKYLTELFSQPAETILLPFTI